VPFSTVSTMSNYQHLQRDAGVEGAHQIRSTYTNESLVLCFRFSSALISRGNVLLICYLDIYDGKVSLIPYR